MQVTPLTVRHGLTIAVTSRAVMCDVRCDLLFVRQSRVI